MEKIFRKARIEEVEEIYNLYVERIRWMDKNGIRGWNTTNYLARYPLSYYRGRIESEQLYVLREVGSGTLMGAVVLLDADERWNGKPDIPAYYVHNLGTKPGIKGAGSVILDETEQLAKKNGKHSIRLDCSIHSSILNNYYASRGYENVGMCYDKPYEGYLREKLL